MSKRFGLVIDQERCIGCEACTVACKIENNSTKNWIQVKTNNSAQQDTPLGKFPDLEMNFLPLLCNHCDNPPCVGICPTDALVKREDGPVILDEEKCDGCESCMDACPYGMIFFNHEKDKVEKCNLCIHRLDRGLEPFCVICCEGQAMYFGDVNDTSSLVARRIADKNTFQLKPEDGTSPAVYYCPPKPRMRL
ncbi:MAG: 4Fe-4S dicluster domain-containing protein [Desulfobacterales bacterium]|nr:4Fe-4S dicluster domain-containing protein [Desulfobacterales bacterium]